MRAGYDGTMQSFYAIIEEKDKENTRIADMRDFFAGWKISIHARDGLLLTKAREPGEYLEMI